MQKQKNAKRTKMRQRKKDIDEREPWSSGFGR